MTAVRQYSVYKGLSSAGTLLGNVQSITLRRGRKKIQDPFKAGTVTIVGRVPSALPTLAIGDAVTVEYDAPGGGGSTTIFNGRVADYSIQYGMIASQDLWTLYVEDALATLGRAYTSSTAALTAGDTTTAAAQYVGTNVGVTVQNASPTVAGSKVSGVSIPDTNALNVVNQLAATEQGRLFAIDHDKVFWYNRNVVQDLGYNFTDGTVATSNSINYDVVEFASYADSFADRVVVQPEGLAEQATAAAGDRTFSMASYDQTTTQARNLADYVLATLQVSASSPTRISTSSAVSANDAMFLRAITTVANAGAYLLTGLVLRGTTYKVYVEGAELTANTDMTRISFDVVPSDADNFFILDSTQFGVLDSSRLGF